MSKILPIAFACIICVLLGGTPADAGSDLDDGMGSYTDDRITKYDELGKKKPNISYEIVKAKSKSNKKGSKSVGAGNDNKGIGNVNLGAGTVVKGDIIVIQEIKDASVISGK